MDLGAMTVSLRVDLSGLEAGLRQAQGLLAQSAQSLARQEVGFRQAGAAASDYGAGVSQSLGDAQGAVNAVGRSCDGLQREWRDRWQAMDDFTRAALARITRHASRAVAAMIVDGGSLRDFWSALWRDLVEIAVERLLQLVLETRSAGAAMADALSALTGGLLGGGGGGLLGGLVSGVGNFVSHAFGWLGFDNPTNDAWARKQGVDFGRNFRGGVAAAMGMPATLSSTLALAGLGSVRGAGGASLATGAVQVTINAQKLDERVVREAGGLIADEVARRLGWTDRRSGF